MRTGTRRTRTLLVPLLAAAIILGLHVSDRVLPSRAQPTPTVLIAAIWPGTAGV
jgi:hypothetical protein